MRWESWGDEEGWDNAFKCLSIVSVAVNDSSGDVEMLLRAVLVEVERKD